jgi:1-aminocyclopropane-1-carboxylate deaminase/D-cysteine desulfhydrase-like pyridoxal-dependent ACC family enzyme
MEEGKHSTHHRSVLDKKGRKLTMLDLCSIDSLGNKRFKLKGFLSKAHRQGKTTLISLGGNRSNHLHALAHIGQEVNMTTIGIVRGEERSTPTLDDCKAKGMILHFVSRNEFSERHSSDFMALWLNRYPEALFIPEGGSGFLGTLGVANILSGIDFSMCDRVVLPVGSGGTYMGLLKLVGDRLWGYPMVHDASLPRRMQDFLPMADSSDIQLDYSAAGRGFAKLRPEDLEFQDYFLKEKGVLLDKTYNLKLARYLFQDDSWSGHWLWINTGGLQADRD